MQWGGTSQRKRATFARSTPGRYLIRYDARAPRTSTDTSRSMPHALREGFVAHLPEGVTLSREVWGTIGC